MEMNRISLSGVTYEMYILQLVCETTLETVWTGFLHLYYKIKHLNTIDDYGSSF